jgi:hypothetical protein
MTLRGKDHWFLMTLDLYDWSQRLTYSNQRYYDLSALCVLFTGCLEPVIKLDVQGFERHVTAGLQQTLWAFEPVNDAVWTHAQSKRSARLLQFVQ